MLKFTIAILAVTTVSMVAAVGQNIQLQRCDDVACTQNCHTIVEFQGGVCHNAPGWINHGETLTCRAAPAKTCFTESIFDDSAAQGCKGPVVQQAPREGDVCTEDIIGGQFFKYSNVGTVNFTLSRGCDYGCNNCDIIVPVSFNTCHRFPQHSFWKNYAIELYNPASCNPAIRADLFFSPVCDGFPDIVHSVFTDQCYVIGGRGHQYLCS